MTEKTLSGGTFSPEEHAYRTLDLLQDSGRFDIFPTVYASMTEQLQGSREHSRIYRNSLLAPSGALLYEWHSLVDSFLDDGADDQARTEGFAEAYSLLAQEFFNDQSIRNRMEDAETAYKQLGEYMLEQQEQIGGNITDIQLQHLQQYYDPNSSLEEREAIKGNWMNSIQTYIGDLTETVFATLNLHTLTTKAKHIANGEQVPIDSLLTAQGVTKVEDQAGTDCRLFDFTGRPPVSVQIKTNRESLTARDWERYQQLGVLVIDPYALSPTRYTRHIQDHILTNALIRDTRGESSPQDIDIIEHSNAQLYNVVDNFRNGQDWNENRRKRALKNK